jgi:uncharacterized protein Usg
MLQYITPEGEEIKQFRKAWEANKDGCLDIVMKNYDKVVEPDVEEVEVEVEVEEDNS